MWWAACWRTNPTGGHATGNVKKGGPVNCDSLGVQTSVLRASPSPCVLGKASQFQFRWNVRGWDLSREFPTLVFLLQVACEDRTPPPAVALGTQEVLSSR